LKHHLVWFRTDLRTLDNTALWQACSDPEAQVTAVFCRTPGQWREHDMAPIRERFIDRNLRALSLDLDSLGIPLVVLECDRYGDANSALLGWAREQGATRVFANREYPVNEQARDRDFDEAANGNIACHWFDDFGIKPLGLLTKTGNPYTVFSPFKRAWLERWRQSPAPIYAKPEPRQHRSAVERTELTALPKEPLDRIWPAGEHAALERLAYFAENTIGNYKAKRDLPAEPGTSELSPYLAAGVLSARVCLDAAMAANQGHISEGRAGPDTWISELIWRDFYVHILDTFPRVSKNRCFRVDGEAIPWRDAPEDFKAWCEGRTGYPIVDAAMRQLVQTGWMHNRLRMLVAMFLTKQLLIDWRMGERFFMQHLIDGDLGANNGGWQWAASTGTDAAPYFRIFNPITQSQKFDASGAFIRRFVPEVAELSDKDIHMPAPLVRQSLAEPYPAPIVELKFARERCLNAFKSVQK